LKRSQRKCIISFCNLRRAGAAVVAALLLVNAAAAVEIDAGALARLPKADVVILGEVHDNPAHHSNQALAVAAIAPRALVFEMLTPAQAARTPEDRDDRAAVEKALGWAESGWPEFGMYHPIFLAAPGAKVFGGDLPPGEVSQSVTDGAAAVFGAQAARYGLTASLAPEDQAAREAEMQEAHCGALPDEVLPGMVQAQRLRDAALARAVVQAFQETGGPVVVITGNGHARRDQGVPAVLAQAMPELSVLSVGQLEGSAGTDPPFDRWIVTPILPRDDPCDAFGIRADLVAAPVASG
jgi:uncharacterized iron-regulated protein